MQPARAQERVAIRGTLVTLVPPPGFKVSRTVRGIENTETGSTITIAERSAEGYAQLAEMFTSPKSLSAGFGEQDVTIRSVRQVAVGDGYVPFAIGTQRRRGGGSELVKYLALLRGDKTTLVTFTLGDRSFTEADAETLIRSIELARAPTTEELLEQLPFTLRVVEPFRVTNVASRTSVTLETGEEDGPVIVIGRGASRALMGEEARVAVELLKTTGGFVDAEIGAQGPAPFAGGNGYRVSAVLGDRTIVQYLAIVPGGYYLRFVARGETSALQAVEAAVEEIAGSVEPD
ncbi:MAG TPA: hypothetical protein VKA43_04615 [Gammaproteobacteria bacterium]|nr:hypothetical protein [Gammaproteobacteria bacterium]